MSEEPQGTGKRFRILADALFDGNKSDLARAMGMEPGSFTKYTRGARRPGAGILERLTRLGVNLNWFLTGEGPMMVVKTQPSSSKRPLVDSRSPMSASELLDDPNQYYPIPLIEVRTSDEGEVHLNEVDDPEWLSASFIRRQYGVEPERLRVFRATCNAMADTIRPGDRLRTALLDSDGSLEDLTSGNVYLILGPSGVFSARIHKNEDTSDVLISGENPEVDDESVSLQRWKDAFRPIARVLEVVRPL